MIIIEKLTKAYDGQTIISNYSTEIEDGECLIFSMPSGKGKTTLLRLISGLEKPDSGCIRGVPETIGYVFQEDRLCDNFTATENIMLVCKESKETIEKHLSILGLSNDLNKPVKEYSGGMKRRVAVARAVLYDCGIILFDEPFTGMDERTRAITLDYILDNCNQRTVFLVSHEDDIINKVRQKRKKVRVIQSLFKGQSPAAWR